VVGARVAAAMNVANLPLFHLEEKERRINSVQYVLYVKLSEKK
jgi:hypothetical protein